jgi:hypothetical protein
MVDPGTARVGNRWIERSWSAFMGQTIELTPAGGEKQWLAESAPEFEIETDVSMFGVMALGDVEWSEECNPFAAGLTMRKSGAEGLGIAVRTLAFHDCPAMLRLARVFNTGSAPVTLRRVRLDLLPLDPRDAEVLSGGLAAEGHAAVVSGRHGLLLGAEGTAEVHAFEEGSGLCAVDVAETATLRQGGYVDLPAAHLLAFTGGMGPHVEKLHERFQAQWQALRAWEAERAQSIRDEAGRN